MKGPYLEPHELKQFNQILEDHVLDDTIGCWIRTRIRGGSASMSCEGNVSIPLIKALDKLKIIIDKKEPTIAEQGEINIKTKPQPEGQKFNIGARVWVAEDLGSMMSNFKSGCEAIVDHTYAHAYGGNNVNKYMLNIGGWYYEDQLTLIDEEALKGE